MKRIFYKMIVVLLIISLFLTFIYSNKSSVAVPKTDDFYYHGTTGASYSRTEAIGLSGVAKALIEWILGIITLGPRMVIVGWISIFEWLLVITVDNVCGTDYKSMYEVDPFGEINEIPNRITVEKIVFNEIPLFDANVFDFEHTTLEDYADKSK